MISLSSQNLNQEILKQQFEREVQENFSSLLKQKREKLRNEIRRSDLSNSLKEKRIFYSKFDFDSENGLNELVLTTFLILYKYKNEAKYLNRTSKQI